MTVKVCCKPGDCLTQPRKGIAERRGAPASHPVRLGLRCVARVGLGSGVVATVDMKRTIKSVIPCRKRNGAKRLFHGE